MTPRCAYVDDGYPIPFPQVFRGSHCRRPVRISAPCCLRCVSGRIRRRRVHDRKIYKKKGRQQTGINSLTDRINTINWSHSPDESHACTPSPMQSTTAVRTLTQKRRVSQNVQRQGFVFLYGRTVIVTRRVMLRVNCNRPGKRLECVRINAIRVRAKNHGSVGGDGCSRQTDVVEGPADHDRHL
jgi:hypothetical protein